MASNRYDDRYGSDVLADGGRSHQRRKRVAIQAAELELVVEEAVSGYCGAIVAASKTTVTLEDRHGRRRVFPYAAAGFLCDGEFVTLAPPAQSSGRQPARRTASGSIAVENVPAKVAQASRIYVEGVHDAALVERVWGDDLRIEGIVVEPLHGVDDLPSVVAQFQPGAQRRLGVLVDHLVPGSKESRIVAGVRNSHVLVTGHPYVDIWQAVKPAAVGIPQWPTIVDRSLPWKESVCHALGASDVHEMWRRVLAAVDSYADLETPLVNAVERLIDFVAS